MMRRHPEEYLEDDGNHRKFGHIGGDGAIVVPNRLTLKWIPNYYWRLNEQKSTWIAYGTSFSFSLLGLAVFT